MRRTDGGVEERRDAVFRPDLVPGKPRHQRGGASDGDARRTFMTPALCGPEFHHSKGSSPQTGARRKGENRQFKPYLQRYREGSNAGAVRSHPTGGDAHVDGTFR